MKIQYIAAAAVTTLLMTTSSYALDVSIGGIDASVSVGGGSVASVGASIGGDSGVNADASVGGGSVASVNASVGGGGGVNAGATVGGTGGTTATASVGGTNGGSKGGTGTTNTNGTKTNGTMVTRRGDTNGALLTKSQKVTGIMKGMIVLSRDRKVLGTVDQVSYNADGSANILIDVNPAYRARIDQVWLRLSSLGAPDDVVNMNISQASFLKTVL